MKDLSQKLTKIKSSLKIKKEKKYDEANFKLEDALYYRLNFQINLLQLFSYLQEEQNTCDFNKIENYIFTCLKALEVIKRTGKFSKPVDKAFSSENMCSVPIDIQIRQMTMKNLEESFEYFENILNQIVATVNLGNLTDIIDIFESWDLINKQGNSFLMTAIYAIIGLDPSGKKYFRSKNYESIIKANLLKYKYDFDQAFNLLKPDEAESRDYRTFLEFSETFQNTLAIMSSSRPHLYNYLESSIDFIYFLYLGTKLQNDKDSQTRKLYLLPTEIALWMFRKKMEIGFEMDQWPDQLIPHVLFWWSVFIKDTNSTIYMQLFPFEYKDLSPDKVMINKLLLNSFDANKHKVLFKLYESHGLIMLLKAMGSVYHFLLAQGIVRSFLPEKELGFAYNAKLAGGFKEAFFLKKYTFEECNDEISQFYIHEGKTPSENLLTIKTHLFETSKFLQTALKHYSFNEERTEKLQALSKVGCTHSATPKFVPSSSKVSQQKRRLQGNQS